MKTRKSLIHHTILLTTTQRMPIVEGTPAEEERTMYSIGQWVLTQMRAGNEVNIKLEEPQIED